jgi:hypothetical protein
MKQPLTCAALLTVLSLTVVMKTSALAQEPPVAPCRVGDWKCWSDVAMQSPIKHLPYWKSAFEKPVEQRIGPAPSELVEYLRLANISQEFPNKPRSAAIPEDFLKDVNDAIAEMPSQAKHAIDKKLAGIYFVQDLGGSGFTDDIQGATAREAGFIVLDLDVLSNRTANAWATWKENTPFKVDARFKLAAEIEAKGQDNRKNAIQYILLHEFAHVLSINEEFHPRMDQGPSDPEGYPFAALSWELVKETKRYGSLFETDFPLRKDVRYYLGAKLDSDKMIEAYEELESTNFPTLYAATNPADDFAESFVSFVHTVLLKRPLSIRLYRDGNLAKTYNACWEEKRCAAKRKLLEERLGP